MTTLHARLAWALVALLAVAGAQAALFGVGQGRAEGAPSGWAISPAPTRYVDPAQLGPIGLSGASWSLAQYRTLTAAAPARTLDLAVVLPEGGALTIQPAGGATTLLLAHGEAPAARTSAGDDGRPLECAGSLPPPGAAPYALTIEPRPDGFLARSGADTMTCRGAPGAGGPILTAGLLRVGLPALTLDGVPAAPPLPGWLDAVGIVVVAGLLLLVAAGERLAGAALLEIVVTTAPLAICFVFVFFDVAEAREALRLPELPTRWLPLLTGALPAAGLKLLTHGARLARRRDTRALRGGAGALALLAAAVVAFAGARAEVGTGALILLPPLAAAVLAPLLARTRADAVSAPAVVALGAVGGASFAAALGADQPGARLYLGLAGALVGGLQWVVLHATVIRLYNTAALALAFAVFGCLEMSARFTSAERYWTESIDGNGAGSRRTMLTTFEGLSGASTAAYPTSGFPARAPARSAPVRVVCLGSSSTGGAFQNDDLSEFYPARLAERLGPNVEVVNQGVGGWASFHVEKFAATYLPEMQPDVVTVYLGMNEATPAATTYADLYAQWSAGGAAPAPNPLYGLRLFNGLRFVVQAARGPFGDAAVPPAQFEENLERIAATAARVGARVLLLSEAMQPSPSARAAYWERMRAVDARHDDVVFLDTAQTVAGAGAGLFLDANHLSSEGHRLLAGLLAEELQRLGWLQPKAAAPR